MVVEETEYRVQTNRKEEKIGDCVVLEVVVVGQMLSIKTLLVLLIRPVVNMEILNADQVVTLPRSQLNDRLLKEMPKMMIGLGFFDRLDLVLSLSGDH